MKMHRTMFAIVGLLTSITVHGGGTIFNTYPGTRVPDRSSPAYTWEQNRDGSVDIYRTYSGTQVPDRSDPVGHIEYSEPELWLRDRSRRR